MTIFLLNRTLNFSSYFPQIIKDWEVIDDVQVEMQGAGDDPQDRTAPGICEGYLLKRRKWPLKGWHKVRSQCTHSQYCSNVGSL